MTRFFALLLTLVLSAGTLGANYDISTPARVVAFGDVHGAFADWSGLLRELGVIDEQMNWSGGNTHLVSLGDLLDRGPDSRKVVELLMKLDQQAEQAGGAVHMVLGNHEVMVMTGDLRYVSPQEFAAFAGDETQADRDALFAQYRSFNPEGDEAALRQTFDDQYPAGFVALRKAFSQEGALGSWLVQQPFVVKVNDKVYMHGGIASVASEDSLATLNGKLQGELKAFLDSMDTLRAAGVMPWYVDYHDRLAFLNARAEEFVAANPKAKTQPDWFPALKQVFEAQQAFVFSDDSPNWYRGTAMCHPYAESFNTERFLKQVGAKQLVMGHTPTSGNVHERMDGLAIRLDTGMLASVYKGRASALVSQGGKDYVHYLGSSEKAQPVPEIRSLAQILSAMSDAELEDFMRTAPVVSVEDIGTGITKPKRVVQQRDGISNDAVFKYEDTVPGLQSKDKYISRRYDDSDRYVYDVAAYKLDRMLDWQMVPTAVLAEVNGQPGALSDWVGNAINERDRLEREIAFNSYCKQNEQYRLRFVFDILIHNEDRNLTNILWTKDGFMMQFIDHSLAFRSTKKRPKQYRKVDLQVSDLLQSRLQSLNEGELTRQLSPYLHPRQIEGILARRDLILKEAISSGR
jgi:calcineurin-like phosphoesterase family protein/HipA-like protein